MHRIHSIDRIEGFRQLSARETQLIVLASEGLTDKEIARFLGISNGTVVTMWSRMRAKLGISSRVSAVAVVVTAVSRLCERIGSLRSISDDRQVLRVLVSAKQIALSCDVQAVTVLGIRPGDSLVERMSSGFLGDSGNALCDRDLPWIKTLDTGEAARSCVVRIQKGESAQIYSAECALVEDSTLGLTVMVEFSPVKSVPVAALAESRRLQFAPAK